jgi:hypothetical protein
MAPLNSIMGIKAYNNKLGRCDHFNRGYDIILIGITLMEDHNDVKMIAKCNMKNIKMIIVMLISKLNQSDIKVTIKMLIAIMILM